MAANNSFFDWAASLTRFVKRDTARAEEINDALDSISNGFTATEALTNAAIKLPAGEISAVLGNAAARKGKVLTFNAVTGAAEATLGAQDVVTVAINSASVNTVAANIAGVNVAAANIVAITAATPSAASALNSKNAAAQSAADALIYANAASATSGIPSVATNNLKFLRVNAAGAATEWADASVPVKTYELRGELRTMISPDRAIVEGLGLFIWTLGSTEPDDDETCFATATGAWTLEAASWDVAYAYWLADHSIQEENLEDLGLRATALEAIAVKSLRGTFSMTLTSLSAVTSSIFTATIAGAALGDIVIVTPGDQFGTSAADKGALSYAACVSAANTVTISIRNASAASASMTASTWAVLVIKQ